MFTSSSDNTPNFSFLEKMTKANKFLQLREDQDFHFWLYIPIIAFIGGVLGAIFSVLNLLAIGTVHGVKKAIGCCKTDFYKIESLDKNKKLIEDNADYLLSYVMMAVLGGSGGIIVWLIVTTYKDKKSSTSSLE